VFNGQNGMEYLDDLYNSISKGSAYYVPKVKEETDTFIGNNVTMAMKMADENQAKQAASLFAKAGATTEVFGAQLNVSGDLGNILANCLEDSKNMYHNDGATVSNKYGYNERQLPTTTIQLNHKKLPTKWELLYFLWFSMWFTRCGMVLPSYSCSKDGDLGWSIKLGDIYI
ncbi:MAG: hypothetical protein JRI62_10705, partial [Deltaproteobacteria bacterium]|nr:hypothetical protein [Deltaproteobacteria bacterium]